jgi:hypothetical protein
MSGTRSSDEEARVLVTVYGMFTEIEALFRALAGRPN